MTAHPATARLRSDTETGSAKPQSRKGPDPYRTPNLRTFICVLHTRQAALSVAPDLPHAPQWRARVSDLHAAWEQYGLYSRDTDITPVMYCASLVPGLWLSPAWHELVADVVAGSGGGSSKPSEGEPAGPGA